MPPIPGFRGKVMVSMRQSYGLSHTVSYSVSRKVRLPANAPERHRSLLESRREMLAGLSPEDQATLPAATLHRGIASLEMTLQWLDQTMEKLKSSPSG